MRPSLPQFARWRKYNQKNSADNRTFHIEYVFGNYLSTREVTIACYYDTNRPITGEFRDFNTRLLEK